MTAHARLYFPRLLLSSLSLVLALARSECPDHAGDGYDELMEYAKSRKEAKAFSDAMACFQKAAEADRRRPEPWLNVGELYKNAGKLEEAEIALRQSVALGPAWPLAHFNLANILKDLDRNEESLAEYQEALALDPPFKAAILNNMALAHGTLNQNDLVLESYEKAMRLDPLVPETHNNLASHYQAIGDMANAVKHYRQAVQLRPEKGFLLNLAYALGAKGETAESLKIYMKTIEMYPDYALAYYNLGTSLMGEERYAESEYCYRWAVKLDGTRADYYNNLATVVGASGATNEGGEGPNSPSVPCPCVSTVKLSLLDVDLYDCSYAVSADFVRRLSEVGRRRDMRGLSREGDEARDGMLRHGQVWQRKKP
eukprot:767799-Hanusia_phi.AAC.3